jgi:hypothetical protein
MFEFEINILPTTAKLETSFFGFRIGNVKYFATSFSVAGLKFFLFEFPTLQIL